MNVLEYQKKFYDKFSGEKQVLGKSLMGKDIYLFTIKKTEYPRLIVSYAIHAREYITTYLAIEQIKDFYSVGKFGTVCFIPALNPDGIEISLTKKPLYKANGRGVDLNVNFDACWGKGKLNVKTKGDENYIGAHPFSEPETKLIRDFTYQFKPDATISYHSKGEEIYWEFFQKGKDRERDFFIAKKLSSITGYKIKPTPNSCGGYKDWCISVLKIPAFTIEVGADSLVHPIKKRNLKEIYQKNKGVICGMTEYLHTIKNLC